MPYSGIKPGSDTEKKLERCVSSVMAKNPGWSKSRAIATCRASMNKSEGVMPKTKNGLTARQRRKRKLAETPEAKLLADEPLADIKAEEDEFFSFDDFLDENPEEKMMDTFAIVDFDPPTDFEELDIEREAIEQAEKIREVGWDAERLLRNIVHHPMLDPSEKEQKIAKVGADLAKRLTNETYDEKDLDRAEAEMWAALAGNLSLGEKLHIAKNKFSLNNLPDTAFAGKDRTLPIHDKEHIKHSLMRLAKIKEIPLEAKENVINAAKDIGIGRASDENVNGLIIEKDTTGTYRWIGWVSNNFRDRENEIISEAAHKEFMGYLDENPNMAPEFWTWHTKGTARESKADVWLYHEGFVIMSGPLTDIEAYRLMKAISTDEIGMSHGFFAAKDPNDPTIITKYRTYEVSDLPRRNAANPWTTIEAITKEVTSMSNEKIEYLKGLVGEEYVEALLADAEANKELLTALEIESKEEQEIPEEKEELTPETKTALDEYLGGDAEEIKEFYGTASKLLPAMAKEIVALKEALAESSKDSEETLADMIEGANSKRTKALAARASEKEDNKAEEDEFTPPGLGKSDMWLSKISNTEPVFEEVTQ